MLFAKYKSWDPIMEAHGYELGLTIHDDGDCIKWDWEIYKYVEDQSHEGSSTVDQMYEFIGTLDVSPYNRNTTEIRALFEKNMKKLAKKT
jgi:hypothetical protein